MAVRFLPVSPVGIGNGCSATHTAAGDDVSLLEDCRSVYIQNRKKKKRFRIL